MTHLSLCTWKSQFQTSWEHGFMLQASWPWHKQEELPQTTCTAQLEPGPSRAPRTRKTAPRLGQSKAGHTRENIQQQRDLFYHGSGRKRSRNVHRAQCEHSQEGKKSCCFQSLEKKSIKEIITALVGFQPQKANEIFPFHVHVFSLHIKTEDNPIKWENKCI